MTRDNMLTLYDYNYWANALVLKAAAGVPHDQYVAPARASHGSLRSTLVHVLGAEMIWRRRCQEGVSPTATLSEQEVPTLAALTALWEQEEQAMRAYLHTLQEGDLDRRIHYTTTKGIAREAKLWHILAHVVNHGTQHRSEAGILLTELGHSQGDMDFIVYVIERGL